MISAKHAADVRERVALLETTAAHEAADAIRLVTHIGDLGRLSMLADVLRRYVSLADRDSYFDTIADLPIGTELWVPAERSYSVNLATFKSTPHDKVGGKHYLRGVKRGKKYVGLWLSRTPDSAYRKGGDWRWVGRESIRSVTTEKPPPILVKDPRKVNAPVASPEAKPAVASPEPVAAESAPVAKRAQPAGLARAMAARKAAREAANGGAK